MKIKQVQRILMTNFLFVLLVGFLLVLLYETEILEPTNLAGDVTLVYVITVAMEFLTIAVIPLALKLFSFKAIHRQLVTRKGDALLPLGACPSEYALLANADQYVYVLSDDGACFWIYGYHPFSLSLLCLSFCRKM